MKLRFAFAKITARVLLAAMIAAAVGMVCLSLAGCVGSRHYRHGLHPPNKKLMRHVTYRQWAKSQKYTQLSRRKK